MRQIALCLGLMLGTLAVTEQSTWACAAHGSATSMGDGSALGSDTNLFHRSSAKFLLQQDVAYRTINGTFNDQGTLRDIPTGTSLQALQATLGMAYFATSDLILGVQVPVLGNFYSGAAPGTYGTVELRDGISRGGSVGDVALQAAYRLVAPSGFWPAIGVWLGAVTPTGQAMGTDAEITGAGIWNGQTGITATGLQGPWSYEGGVAFQRPFGLPNGVATNFYVGDAMVLQGTVGYQVNSAWKAGVSMSGYRGQAQTIDMSNLKLTPSVTYSFSPDFSIRLGIGFTPGYVARNAMSDLSASVSLFQFVQ